MSYFKIIAGAIVALGGLLGIGALANAVAPDESPPPSGFDHALSYITAIRQLPPNPETLEERKASLDDLRAISDTLKDFEQLALLKVIYSGEGLTQHFSRQMLSARFPRAGLVA